METPSTIRLLASANNARGDLFTRLAKDLFFALGYDDLRLDVHKSGRELDIQGAHRLEPRRMVAECKAHADKIGGADLNKFLGALTRERDKHEPTPVAGYFVSLNGFRETGKEQELETNEQKRLVLMDGKQVIEELQRCRVFVGHPEAIEKAGHCAEHGALKDARLDGVELLGHERGYLWAVYYSQGKQRSHFALIHADGTPLAAAVAQEVVDADREVEGVLHTLLYLAPPPSPPDRVALRDTAIRRYSGWLTEECGYIQLDGLPADSDLSATRMKLERLFVPLKVVVEKQTVSVGHFIDSCQHAALLATPGGGKSTLLKRLAIAYAAPHRRTAVDDGLPEHDWLPLLLRCRELRDRAHRPILELLNDLPQHAGMNGEEAAAFGEQLHEDLREGRTLLLVDGLDEISDEGTRKTFAKHLRTFVAMFPRTTLLLTSREAGFRHVAGVVAGACTEARLAPFDEQDVRRLCESWHVEVVADNEQVRSEARELAGKIWENERIRALAENPLMLTTLLVVRRCIGELPTRRVELYREAVRVLIRTWNTEGFEPLDLEEALTQLSYVACTMMNEGTQQIGYRSLLKLLQQARRELATELGFTRISAADFIKRIEYRSSLLMQTGHERIDGELQPVYEFRHLTFQEYLAARGFVEEQYPDRDDGRSLADLLEPHFGDESWQEVVPLAAVLAGRKAEETIKRLTARCTPLVASEVGRQTERLLRQCLLDEVQVTPQTLRAALTQAAKAKDDLGCWGLVCGKFGELLVELANDAFYGNADDWDEYDGALVDIALHTYSPTPSLDASDHLITSLTDALANGKRTQKIDAAFVTMWLAYTFRDDREQTDYSGDSRFRPIYESLVRMVDPDDPPMALAATWALSWIGVSGLCRPQPSPDWLLLLYRIWREAPSARLARFAAWAFLAQRALPRDTFNADIWGDCDDFLQEAALGNASVNRDGPGGAAFIVGWYRRSPWDDKDLAGKLAGASLARRYRYVTREMLAELGEAGQEILDKWDKKKS